MADPEPSLSVLGSVSQTLDAVPFAFLLWPHCMIVTSWFPHLRNRFLLSYWVGLLAAMGGGIVSSLLLMDRSRAPVALFSSNSVGLIYTVSWWAVNYFPYQLVRRTLLLFPLRVSAKVCLNILRASLVTSRAELAAKLYPGVIAAPLLLGTIAGSGGKFCIDIMTGATGELKGPSELTIPGFAARSGFFGALLYYLAVTVTHTLLPGEGRALVVVIYVLHGLASDVAGAPLDFTYPLAKLAHALVNVPMPDGQQQAKPAAAESSVGQSESKKQR